MTPARPPGMELLAFLKPYDPEIIRLALDVRSLVLEEAPLATEIVFDAHYAVALGYTFSGRFKETFCHVAVYAKHVNLGFNHGAEFADPKRLLAGTGAQVRHLTVKQVEDLEEPHVRAFLQKAVAQGLRAAVGVAMDKDRPKTVVKASVKKRRPKSED